MKKPLLQISLLLLVVVAGFGAHFAWRAYRLASIAHDWRDQIKYQLVNEGGIQVGSMDAAKALSPSFLAAIFGDNPKLLEKLNESIATGLAMPNRLQLEEIAAMLVTYRTGANDEVTNLCVTNIGNYKSNRMKPGFHRDGFFANTLDRNMYLVGNTIMGFLGRDMVMFAEPADQEAQMRLIDSLFTGEVTNVVAAIQQPLHYTLVIPNPRRMLPPQLRPHIGTLIQKGSMSKYRSNSEMIFMCGSPESAKYAESVLSDMKAATEAILRTKFGGVAEEKDWGAQVQCWWAFEMVMTSEKALLKADENLVRYSMSYGRVMNNAVLKSLERMGRDMLAMTKTFEERKDPRLVDAEMRSNRPSNAWSKDHHWGPNWPIEPPKDDLAAPAAKGNA